MEPGTAVIAALRGARAAWRERTKRREQKRSLLSQDSVGVSELRRTQLYRLGVDAEAPEALQALGISGSSAPYSPRDIDMPLRKALANALALAGVELIVVTGHSKAGKSRAALVAVRNEARQASLLRPAAVYQRPGALADLARRQPPVKGPIVIWLDDLGPWARPDGLTLDVLDALIGWCVPVAVLATA